MRALICIGPSVSSCFESCSTTTSPSLSPSQRASITPIRFSFESGVNVVISRNSGFVSPGSVDEVRAAVDGAARPILTIGVLPLFVNSCDVGVFSGPDATPEGRLRNEQENLQFQQLLHPAQSYCNETLRFLNTPELPEFFLDCAFNLPDRLLALTAEAFEYPDAVFERRCEHVYLRVYVRNETSVEATETPPMKPESSWGKNPFGVCT